MLVKAVADARAMLSRTPTFRARIATALVVGATGAFLIHQQYSSKSDFHSDFGLAWFGARSMFAGVNPYPLVGPGKEFEFGWTLLYPATSFVAVMPIAWLPEHAAAVVFVGLCSFVLGFAITRNGWHLLPMLGTEAFASSARLGQWSLILTAAFILPWIAAVSLAKPQAAFPILTSSVSGKSFFAALVGGVLLLVLSVFLLPTWPADWLSLVLVASHMQAPVTHFGGFLVVLVLLKWRRPESWLLLAMAFTPQAWGWYNTLPLFLVPMTFVEAVFLVGIAQLGGAVGAAMVPAALTVDEFYKWVGGLLVCSTYLPAMLLILRRPNAGPSPVWLNWIFSAFDRKR